MGFKKQIRIHKCGVNQPCLPQCGPYEASEGIYPATDKEKTGAGKENVSEGGPNDQILPAIYSLSFTIMLARYRK
jgi:hypothetical protein